MLDAHTRRFLDLILVSWTALWLLAGVAIWHEVRGLRPLTDTVGVAAQSLDSTAAVLRGVSSVPLLGDRLKQVADDASATATSARQSAVDGRRSVDHLAVILGLAVPAVAILPLGLAYALLRSRRRAL